MKNASCGLFSSTQTDPTVAKLRDVLRWMGYEPAFLHNTFLQILAIHPVHVIAEIYSEIEGQQCQK